MTAETCWFITGELASLGLLALGLRQLIDIYRVGGLLFWRIGRLGGSVYLASRR